MVRCTNCDFFVPDEPASNFKGECGLTCPKCNIIWQTKEDYLKEKKKFVEIFRKYHPLQAIKKDGKFVEISFSFEQIEKTIQEFLEATK